MCTVYSQINEWSFDNRLTVFAFVNFSSHFLISSGETLLLDKSMYPAKKGRKTIKQTGPSQFP